MADEKFDEKELDKRDEKQDEKSPQEKSWDEKWRRDPLSTIVWATIFIWAGVVLLVNNLGIIDQIRATGEGTPALSFLTNLEAWSLVFFGAGVIVLLEILVRLIVPEYRRPVGGTLIFGLVLIGIGLGDVFGWSVIWALILIGIGLSVILRGFTRSR
jgi:vacuolar-type H+-ATPase subunit I/STV1